MRTADPMVADLQQLWADTARWLEAALGLHFTRRQWPDLQRGLQAAAQRLGLPDAAACAQHALAHGLDEAQQQVLAECLTIGETYFFRDPAVFEQLAHQVLQPLIERRREGSRHLRLWSAGCSSGEEAWTLAMVVATLLPEWREWNVSILATDLNPAALQKARAGAYGRWSVRGGLPPAARHLLPLGSDGRYHVDAQLRRMVHFGRLNLAGENYPSPATQTTGLDLILCRNVLIYFEAARVQAVLARLGRCLVDDGWLLTGSVEFPRTRLPGLRPVRLGQLAALRRAPAGAVPTTAPVAPVAPVAPAAPVARAAPVRARPSRPPPEPLPPARPVPAQPIAIEPRAATPAPVPAATETTAQALASAARARADAGELETAEQLCRQAVAQDKLNPDWPYLLASILTERGALDAAEAELRRTLYLEPEHLLARFALGSLALRRGQLQAGRRHLARARARLAACPPAEVVQGSGGLTARELEGIIRRVEEGAR